MNISLLCVGALAALGLAAILAITLNGEPAGPGLTAPTVQAWMPIWADHADRSVL